MNKEKFTCDLRIDMPGLTQLSYLALHWQSPYLYIDRNVINSASSLG